MIEKAALISVKRENHSMWGGEEKRSQKSGSKGRRIEKEGARNSGPSTTAPVFFALFY